MIIRSGLKVLAVGALFSLGAYSTAFAARNAHHTSGGHSSASHTASSRYSSAVGASGRHGRHSDAGTFFASASYTRHGRSHSGASARYAGLVPNDYTGHSGGGIQCVTFARADTGIELSGNANTWWNHAEGVYARGSRPEPGSVLNFRANGSMHMGHVAVVNQVVDSRTVAIDHANWGGPGAVRGGISRDITVVDVSPGNDWSAVRVGLGHSGEFGSIYPTYGFIYNRPDSGVMVAANDRSAPVAGLNPAPRDLRGSALREMPTFEEVAEAPDVADTFPRFGHHAHRHGRTIAFRTVSFHAGNSRNSGSHVSTGRLVHSAALSTRSSPSHQTTSRRRRA